MARLKEQRAWDNFKLALKAREINVRRVENQIGEGMSDVIGINRHRWVFWLENKALDSWPVRSSTLPLLGAFEPGQVPFMRNWCEWGGNAFVLLRVDKEFYLLNPKLQLTALTKDELIGTAVVIGKKHIVDFLESAF